MVKWFLLAEEVVKKVQKCLQSYTDDINEQCARSGCMCDLYGTRCSSYPSEILHEFDTSLHITDCVPNDFKGGK